jgi:hypothetical protein
MEDPVELRRHGTLQALDLGARTPALHRISSRKKRGRRYPVQRLDLDRYRENDRSGEVPGKELDAPPEPERPVAGGPDSALREEGDDGIRAALDATLESTDTPGHARRALRMQSYRPQRAEQPVLVQLAFQHDRVERSAGPERPVNLMKEEAIPPADVVGYEEERSSGLQFRWQAGDADGDAGPHPGKKEAIEETEGCRRGIPAHPSAGERALQRHPLHRRELTVIEHECRCRFVEIRGKTRPGCR